MPTIRLHRVLAVFFTFPEREPTISGLSEELNGLLEIDGLSPEPGPENEASANPAMFVKRLPGYPQ